MILKDILKSKSGNSIPFWLQRSISWDHGCLGNQSVFHKELASAQLSPLPEVREQALSPPPPDLYPVLLLGGVFNQMTYPRGWWGHVLFSAFALSFCLFPACENMNFVSSYLALWVTHLMLLRQVLWSAFTVREGGNRTKTSLMGCMAISAGFLAFTGMSHSFKNKSQISVWKHPRYLPLYPLSKADHDKKCTGFQAIISLNENKKFF